MKKHRRLARHSSSALPAGRGASFARGVAARCERRHTYLFSVACEMPSPPARSCSAIISSVYPLRLRALMSLRSKSTALRAPTFRLDSSASGNPDSVARSFSILSNVMLNSDHLLRRGYVMRTLCEHKVPCTGPPHPAWPFVFFFVLFLSLFFFCCCCRFVVC